ncbi:DUF5655 domain-containing protein [Demequina lignilytica]|uniref:DUF5655 domain-containing protein n=1 Tax=Demequina lignilytica TaxID=3051663 RepID=A0AB35MHE5_9MICO|nr:DUF5655 domain-containing protein [Demequina sp. SYSU T0a273]MDN4483201.1 DUF5655 domain-containing protein [Demequina sp. SYSU T0a273]
MSDLKLFRVHDGTAAEITGSSMALERSLQTLIERNMGTLFGVRFLASEYSTGPIHGGRMDSLGIDENGSPVIFEYKRATNENVVNQGLFYLDWLVDHRADFTLLVMKVLGQQASEEIDWRNPRLVCVANGFTKYDEHAVKQMNRAIDLVRYRDFDGDLLALELLTSTKVESQSAADAPSPASARPTKAQKTVSELLAQAPEALADLYDSVDVFCSALGDDVSKKTLKYYFAYRRLQNFACVEVHPQSGEVLMYLKLDPNRHELVEGFIRDVSSIGHFGTGDLEIRLRSQEDFARVQELITAAYEAN